MPLAPLLSSPKRWARAVLTSAPLYGLARTRALRGDPVTVLMYHTVGDDVEEFDAWTIVRRADFVRQMDFVRERYEVVSLDEAMSDAPRERGGRPRAVVTFDDGHAGLHSHVLPIVERERLPVTVYVATGHIESGQPYWFDRLMNALQTESACTVDLGEIGCWDVGGRRGAANWDVISALLRAIKDAGPRRREELTARVLSQVGSAPRRRVTPLSPLSASQLRELADSRWVTIGAHTHRHELLDQIPVDEAADTITRSRELLQAWTRRSIDHFAYPNGNHNEALAREVERLGFVSATTTCPGLWHARHSRYRIPRVPVGRYDDFDKFKFRLVTSGVA